MNEENIILNAHMDTVELAPLHNPRYPLGKPYIKEYWKHVPISEPEEDASSRILMYLVRNQVQLASLYPTEDKLRDMSVDAVSYLFSTASH